MADDLPLFTLNKALVVSGFWTSAIPQGYSNTVEILASGKVPGVLEPGESVTVPVYYAGMQQPWNLSEIAVQVRPSHFHPDRYGFGRLGQLASRRNRRGSRTPPGHDIWQPGHSLFNLEKPVLPSVSEYRRSGSATMRPVRSTWGGYVQLLDNEASYLGQLGEDVTDVNSLWGFAVQQADNALSPLGPIWPPRPTIR